MPRPDLCAVATVFDAVSRRVHVPLSALMGQNAPRTRIRGTRRGLSTASLALVLALLSAPLALATSLAAGRLEQPATAPTGCVVDQTDEGYALLVRDDGDTRVLWSPGLREGQEVPCYW